MSSESQTWYYHVRPVLLAHRLDPVRIENAAGLGTPDINYAEGWIELKYKREWPRRVTTPLRIEHFTPQQRVFLRRRWRMGGKAFLLLRVESEFLLFDGETAGAFVGRVSRSSLYERCIYRSRSFSDLSFVDVLMAPRVR